MELTYNISARSEHHDLALPENSGIWRKFRDTAYNVEVPDTRAALEHFAGNTLGSAVYRNLLDEEIRSGRMPAADAARIMGNAPPRDFGFFREYFIRGLTEAIRHRVPVYGDVTHAKLREFIDMAMRTDFGNMEEAQNLYAATLSFSMVAERSLACMPAAPLQA